jgi:hypothetical protein
MVKLEVVPTHVFAVGVTIILAVTGAVVELVAVNEPIEPEPLAARPMDGVLFVQVKVVPEVGLVNVSAAWVALLQTV